MACAKVRVGGYVPAASSVRAMLAAPISLRAESRRTSRSNTAPTARWLCGSMCRTKVASAVVTVGADGVQSRHQCATAGRTVTEDLGR